MNQFQMANEHLKLERFHYWLTYGLYSGIFLFCAIFFPLVFALPAIGLVVLGFSVYLIRSLIQLGKKGWVISYVVVMGVPLFLAILLSDSEIIGTAVWFFPLVIFYLYCWLLRHSVIEWLSDVGDEKAFELRDKHDKEVQDVMDKIRGKSF